MSFLIEGLKVLVFLLRREVLNLNHSNAKSKLISNLIISTVIVALPCSVWAKQAPPIDAGKALEGLKRPELSVPQKQESKVDIEPLYKPPLEQDNGDKILVKQFRITGQNLVSDSDLSGLLADSRGKELSLQDLRGLAGRITNYFHAKGYIMARAYIPAQEIKDGQVEIAVMVGRYDKIIIRSKVDIAEWLVRMELGEVRSGAYIEKSRLERGIWLISDLAGVQAKASLAAGSQPGTADLILNIQPKGKKHTGSIGVDNYGNRYTGRNEVTLYYKMNNPGQRGDRLIVSGVTTGDELGSGNVTYETPAWKPGGKFQLEYSQMRYELGEEYVDLNATGTAKTASLSYIQTLKRSQKENLYAQIGYGDRRLQDKVGTETTADKRANLVTLVLNGDSLDTWGGGGANSYSLAWTFGRLSIDNATAQEIDEETANSAGSYTKFALNALRQQYINKRLSLMVSLNGQLASKNLDSSEKMSLGGAYGVRAYPKGEASGDIGYLATAELRWTLPLANPKAGMLQMVGFIDGGSVIINKNNWTELDNRRNLYGGGLGLIWNKPGDYMLRLSYAWKIGSEQAKSDTDKNGRLWVLGTKYF